MDPSKLRYLAFAAIIGLGGIVMLLFIKKVSPQIVPSGNKAENTIQRPSPINDYSLMLKPMNASSEEGSVHFSAIQGGKTAIEISMTRVSNSATRSASPAYIRQGMCNDPGEIVMTLERLKDGKSKTVITDTLEELLKKGNLIVAIHKPITDTYDITSCAELKKL